MKKVILLFFILSLVAFAAFVFQPFVVLSEGFEVPGYQLMIDGWKLVFAKTYTTKVFGLLVWSSTWLYLMGVAISVLIGLLSKSFQDVYVFRIFIFVKGLLGALILICLGLCILGVGTDALAALEIGKNSDQEVSYALGFHFWWGSYILSTLSTIFTFPKSED